MLRYGCAFLLLVSATALTTSQKKVELAELSAIMTAAKKDQAQKGNGDCSTSTDPDCVPKLKRPYRLSDNKKWIPRRIPIQEPCARYKEESYPHGVLDPRELRKNCPDRCTFLANKCMSPEDAFLAWANEVVELNQIKKEAKEEEDMMKEREKNPGKEAHLYNPAPSKQREIGEKRGNGELSYSDVVRMRKYKDGRINWPTWQEMSSLQTGEKISSALQTGEKITESKRNLLNKKPISVLLEDGEGYTNAECKETCNRFSFAALQDLGADRRGAKDAAVHDVAGCEATCDQIYPVEGAEPNPTTPYIR